MKKFKIYHVSHKDPVNAEAKSIKTAQVAAKRKKHVRSLLKKEGYSVDDYNIKRIELPKEGSILNADFYRKKAVGDETVPKDTIHLQRFHRNDGD